MWHISRNWTRRSPTLMKSMITTQNPLRSPRQGTSSIRILAWVTGHCGRWWVPRCPTGTNLMSRHREAQLGGNQGQHVVAGVGGCSHAVGVDSPGWQHNTQRAQPVSNSSVPPCLPASLPLSSFPSRRALANRLRPHTHGSYDGSSGRVNPCCGTHAAACLIRCRS